MVTAENPILPGFYPDPSICRVGEDYYIVNSSFAYFPGVPVFHSRDLAHWEQIGNILERKEQLPLFGSEISKGIFAPTIRYHGGVFYMITTNVSIGGNFIVTAEQPEGPWSDPYYLGDEAEGIDPSLFFDEDGRCYYVGTRPNPSGVRHNGDWEIWVQELDLTSMKLKGESTAIWKGALKNCIWPEGPHLYKKDGYYYLMIAEGGTGPEHSISVARSEKLTDWFAGCKRNPIFSHRNLGQDYPVVYAGHGDLVDDGYGNWYVIMLASRMCKRHCSMGRETFLAKVTWEDGWPVIAAGVGHLQERVELPFTEHRFAEEVSHTDAIHFYRKTPDVRLLSIQMREPGMYSLQEKTGALRLFLRKERVSEPLPVSYMGIRQKDYRFHVSAGMKFTPRKSCETAGLLLYQNHENHLRFEIVQDGDGRYAVLISCVHGAESVNAKVPLPAEELIELHMEAAEQEAAFFVCDMEGRMTEAAAHVSLLPYTTEEAGGFVGCTIGMYASANGKKSDNYADFTWLIYEGKR